MISCKICQKYPAAKILGRCRECILQCSDPKLFQDIHATTRADYRLPPIPPASDQGAACRLCTNMCRMDQGNSGYCGIRVNKDGKNINRSGRGNALAHIYLDPLPTNCCAAWFCEGSGMEGNNLSVFFYGCNFNCLYCQNESHKNVYQAGTVTGEELIEAALDDDVRCVCFFGGSPEPHLPFALNVGEEICHESRNQVRICWEWNGGGHPDLVDKAAELSHISGGTVKFDLKAYSGPLHHALCGVGNGRTLENFVRLAAVYPGQEVVTASTLLVPYYIDHHEVEQIARFIAGCGVDIPYSLLVFHPDFYLDDLPVTPLKQVRACYDAACKHLKRVHIGNKHLLQFAL